MFKHSLFINNYLFEIYIIHLEGYRLIPRLISILMGLWPGYYII